ncbi:ester cyclase [uncultured Chryseobacterium sp.]|uniref:nuclear transport factor 2 family protein n=1 Tax=uncultured Chryseobacterium sp. TaxID=259322 RepID=UPI002582A18A|nr:ester cyclase [uncultured Chryseobacterium sp.]
MKTTISVFLLLTVLFMSNGISAQSRKTSQSELDFNKKLVIDFYQKIFGDHDFTNIDRYMLSTYIQHNPHVADGAEAFEKAVRIWLKDAPKKKVDVQRIAAENDLVFLHTKNRLPDGKLQSVIDIFRIENKKITEHWDVQEIVPDQSANSHPMF